MTTTLLVLAAALVLGLTYESWARGRDRRTWTPTGKLIDVGGHRLHAKTHGEGDVVIVFEADEGAWSTHWGRLPEDTGSVGFALAYDRGGLGWSEAGPPPRDAETLARELHQLLARVAPGLPALLVGHGTAAHVLRAYAHRYPFETAGLVFVDPRHDGFADRLRREQIPTAAPSRLGMRILSLAARVGLLRLLQSKVSGNQHLRLSERQLATLDALELDPRVRKGAAEELVAEAQSLDYLGRIAETQDFPMRVLTSTETLGDHEVPASFPRAEYNRIWVEESEAFLDLSKRAERLLVEGSGHQLQLERPEVVLQAILDVLDEARALRANPDGERTGAPATRGTAATEPGDAAAPGASTGEAAQAAIARERH